MFQALRSYFRPSGDLAAPARQQRWRKTSRLFLFEFVVVVAGVLVAQMLQEWVNDLRRHREADSALAVVRGEAAVLRATAEHWIRIKPCLARHVDDISRAAADGRALTKQEIGRPALPLVDPTPRSEATTDAMRTRFGTAAVTQIQLLSNLGSLIGDSQRHVGSQWATFPLLDPALGTPSSADRANVRLAAAQIATELNFIDYQARVAVRTTSRLGITSSPVRSADIGIWSDACGLLHNWGETSESRT